MKLIIAYLICGIVTGLYATLDETHKGNFNPYTADENDEEALGNIVLAWPVYVYHRLMERNG